MGDGDGLQSGVRQRSTFLYAGALEESVKADNPKAVESILNILPQDDFGNMLATAFICALDNESYKVAEMIAGKFSEGRAFWLMSLTSPEGGSMFQIMALYENECVRQGAYNDALCPVEVAGSLFETIKKEELVFVMLELVASSWDVMSESANSSVYGEKYTLLGIAKEAMARLDQPQLSIVELVAENYELRTMALALAARNEAGQSMIEELLGFLNENRVSLYELAKLFEGMGPQEVRIVEGAVGASNLQAFYKFLNESGLQARLNSHGRGI